MTLRYLTALALTLAILLAAPALAAKPARHRARPAPATASLRSLYSQRALRRARIILQLTLLELREQRLERVRKAVERGIPIDQLLNAH